MGRLSRTRSFVCGTKGSPDTICVKFGWCAKEGVPRAIITHCGSEIVTGDERNLAARFRAMGAERGVETRIAHDEMELVLR